MTTHVALFRRPEGGPEARSAFERRDVAPGLATLPVLEDAPEWADAASSPVDTVTTTTEGAE